MRRARIIEGTAVDVVSMDPALVYTPEIAAQFIDVPDEVDVGWMQLQEIVGTDLGPGLTWRPPRSFIEEYLPDKYRYALHEALPPPVYAAPAAPREISKLAFRNRFTRSEKVALELAALDNPSAPMAQRQASAALRADLADQRDALYIDLDREDTRAGVQALEASGLIAPGRAVEILDAPIQDHERFHR